MNKVKGLIILAGIVVALAVIGFTAFKTIDKGPSGLTQKQVEALLATDVNKEIATANLQGTVATVGCKQQKQADASLQLAAGDYFCLVGVKTPGGDLCFAFGFALADGKALPPNTEIRVAQADVTACRA